MAANVSKKILCIIYMYRKTEITLGINYIRMRYKYTHLCEINVIATGHLMCVCVYLHIVRAIRHVRLIMIIIIL